MPDLREVAAHPAPQQFQAHVCMGMGTYPLALSEFRYLE